MEGLEARLNDWAGPDISVALSIVAGEDGLLGPEPEAVARAIPKRRAEFAAGRRAARQALKAARLPENAIPQGEHRAPIWPPGTIGSISHHDGLAVACVASTDRVSRLGIDLADDSAFPARLRDQVLKTSAEQAQSGIGARINFSAKESVFKAFFPDVGAYFGFGAAEVLPDLEHETFIARLLRDLGPVPAGGTFAGQFLMEGNRLFTLLAVRA